MKNEIELINKNLLIFNYNHKYGPADEQATHELSSHLLIF